MGGAIVDRFSRRILLLVSDCVRAFLTGALVVLIASGHLHFGELLVFAVLFGTFDALFMPAITAITPEIVPEDLLPAMNAVRPLSNNLMGNMIGPAVGGVIAAASTTWAIGVDWATFVVRAGALFLMQPTPAARAQRPATSMLDEISEGVRYVRTTRWIWIDAVWPRDRQRIRVHADVRADPLLPAPRPCTSASCIVGYAFAVFGLSGARRARWSASNLKTPRRRIRVMITYWTVATLSARDHRRRDELLGGLDLPVVVSPPACSWATSSGSR